MTFIIDILQITGALALFIFGMKVMSDGIQKAAGGQLRQTLRNITKKPLNGILVGLGTTGLVQSSSATTVMTISFVNAGLISVRQSVGLIMGANIGTTITAWLVSLGGFLFKLSSLTIPALTLVVPLYLRGGKRNKYWAEFLIGFCLLFIGLDFLKESLPQLGNEEVFEAIKDYTLMGFGSRLLFVVVGVVLTIVVQSSSAAMTLTLALVFNGWISPELGCAMIIGENIGTTVTAEIAALVGNVYARQSATVHTLFNLIGAVWMILLIGPILILIENLFAIFSSNPDPFASPQLSTLALAAFHSLFNIVNTAVLIPAIPYLVKLSGIIRTQKSKKDVRARLKYMDTTIGTPELSTIEIQSRLVELAATVETMVVDLHASFKSIDEEEKYAMHKQLRKEDKRNVDSQYTINQFIIKIAREELTESTSDLLQRYISITNELIRISNLTVNIALELKDKSKSKIWFTPEQRSNLHALFEKVLEAAEIMRESLINREFKGVNNTQALKLEKEIDDMRDLFREDIGNEPDKFDFNVNGVLVYFRILTLLEKIGDKCCDISIVMAEE